MVNKKKIRLTEEEFKQFVGEIVDSVMLNEQADNGQTEWYGTPLNKDGFITHKEKGGNRISFMSSRGIEGDNRINKQVDSGKWGYNPYDQPQKGISAGALVNLKAYYKKDLPFGKMSDRDMAVRDNLKSAADKCPTPKPIQRPGAPKLKVGDEISGVFIVTNIQKSYHSESEVELYKMGRSRIGVFADNILSSWDGEPPLQIEVTLKRKHDKNTPEVEYEYSDELGRFTNANDGFGSKEAGTRGKDPIYVEQNRERISYMGGGIAELRDQLGDESEL